jgi:16S rRNA (guanine966-N2)-methyltransferase
MRIVGGKWAGKALVSPGKRVRPTAEAIREGWLSWLEPDLEGARVLDLFAGTGALGLEALSRGAETVDFVENGPQALHAIKANLARLRVKEHTRLFKKDAFAFLEGVGSSRAGGTEGGKGSMSYDVVLADPPYTSRAAHRLATLWLEDPFSRILSIEHDAEVVLPRGGARRVFGQTAVTTYRKRGKGARAHLRHRSEKHRD